MKGKDKEIERVNEYLSGKMSPEERINFEKELLQNDQLVNILETQSQIHKAILLSQRSKMKEELRALHKDLHKKKEKKPNNYLWIFALAFIILSTFAWYFLSNTKISNEELFADNYQAFESRTNLRGGSANPTLKEAKLLYTSKKFEEATQIFEGLLKENDSNNEMKLMLGISYLESQKYNKAQDILSGIIAAKDPFYSDHAHWYKSLIFLKQDEKENAKNQLKILTKDPNADHYESAIEILKTLK